MRRWPSERARDTCAEWIPMSPDITTEGPHIEQVLSGFRLEPRPLASSPRVPPGRQQALLDPWSACRLEAHFGDPRSAKFAAVRPTECAADFSRVESTIWSWWTRTSSVGTHCSGGCVKQRPSAPTSPIWMMERTQTNGPSDYANVHKASGRCRQRRVGREPAGRCRVPGHIRRWRRQAPRWRQQVRPAFDEEQLPRANAFWSPPCTTPRVFRWPSHSIVSQWVIVTS
jgi:hypothetical protein